MPFQVKQQRKLLLYRSLILSVLLFSSNAWSPSINSLRRLKSFQKRVLKWLSNSNDCDKWLRMLNMLPIRYELIRTDVILLWKIWHKKVDITVELELIKSTNSTRSASTNQFAFKHPRRFKSDNNFFIRAVHTANELIKLNILSFESTLPIFSRDLENYLVQKRTSFNLNNSCIFFIKCFCLNADHNLLIFCSVLLNSLIYTFHLVSIVLP